MSTALAERSWCVVVPHHAQGARLARRRLATELACHLSPTLLSDTIAVLAELVGNAIRHAEPLPGGVVRVAWRLYSEQQRPVVTVRVTDGGAPDRVPPSDQPGGGGGRARSADRDGAGAALGHRAGRARAECVGRTEPR